MDLTIHIRVEDTDRDAIQAIADRQEWSFSQAARKMIKLGILAAQKGKGEDNGKAERD